MVFSLCKILHKKIYAASHCLAETIVKNFETGPLANEGNLLISENTFGPNKYLLYPPNSSSPASPESETVTFSLADFDTK